MGRLHKDCMTNYSHYLWEVLFTIQGRCGIVFDEEYHNQFLTWAFEHQWPPEKTVAYWIENVPRRPTQRLYSLKKGGSYVVP